MSEKLFSLKYCSESSTILVALVCRLLNNAFGWLINFLTFSLPFPEKRTLLDESIESKLFESIIIALGSTISVKFLSYTAVNTSIRRASIRGQYRSAASFLVVYAIIFNVLTLIK